MPLLNTNPDRANFIEGFFTLESCRFMFIKWDDNGTLIFPVIFLFQYYEMSYGLNVEMHKQVSKVTC
jgi:hypothetical protein